MLGFPSANESFSCFIILFPNLHKLTWIKLALEQMANLGVVECFTVLSAVSTVIQCLQFNGENTNLLCLKSHDSTSVSIE